MAQNVFGDPITENTLMGMPQYFEKTITRRDMAQVALHMKNAQEKNVGARQYVEKLKEKWGRGTATLCIIYNATGGTITFKDHYDWFGHIGPVPYPVELANGQWGAFLHVRPTLLPQGSGGAVMYRGRNGDGLSCDWFVAWRNPWNRLVHSNQVVAFVCEECPKVNWQNMYNYFGETVQLHYSYSNRGCKSTVATGNDKTAFLEAVFTLDNLE